MWIVIFFIWISTFRVARASSSTIYASRCFVCVILFLLLLFKVI